MGFSHAGLLCVCPVGVVCNRRSICSRDEPYGLRIAAPCEPHYNAAFHAAALHGNLHLLRKI